jgi:hypothetical protein
MDDLQDRDELVRQLERTQYEGMATLAELDPYAVVYPESGWQVKDVVAHLAAWDEPTALSFQAYAEGGEYSIPGYHDLEAFNWAAYEGRRDIPYTQVYSDWDAARTRIKEIVAGLSSEQLAGDMLFPSGQSRGACIQLIREVWEHQELHFNDILGAIKST